MKRMGMKWVLITVVACWFSISAHFCSATTLSGLVEFSTDASGNFYNGSVWNTRGGDTAVDLWVIRGTNLYGNFVNGPSDALAGISIPLTAGEYTFVVYANQGGFTPHHGVNLFFNGNNSAPGISVFGATQTSADPPYPSFAQDGGSTLTLAFQPVAGANALVFQDGTIRVELIDYRFADFNVYNIDRVSQQAAVPDGGADFIGQFTLRVTGDAPPPPPPPPPAAITLSGLVEFSTDSDGNFFNGSVWNTRGGDTAVDLWVIEGSDRLGPFVNGPADSQAGISIGLSEGDHSFTIYGARGGPTPNHGLNLFFNGDNTNPSISVFGPTQTSADPPFPPFSANSSSQTLTLAFQPIAGAGTLVFQQGDTKVELLDYRWADPSVYNIDRVSQRIIAPEGTTDFIGQFTLRVTKVTVEPTIPRLTGLLEFSTDEAGNFFNGSVWNTQGGDTAVNLWVIQGSGRHAPFVNGPDDAQAGINIQLHPGANKFVIYGNQGGPTPNHGLNLFFNGDNVHPAISVFGPTQTSPDPPFPDFAANHSPSTLTLNFEPVAAAGTLLYQRGDISVMLTDYRWADPLVYNIDRVSQPVAVPDGGPDFIGEFTLMVRAGPGGPPVPDSELSPQFTIEGAQHPFVIACNGQSAQVTLSGRGSADFEGDVLSYAWFAGASQSPFSTAPVVTTTAQIGVFTVTLRVSDAQSSANETVIFEVITPAEAAAQLSLLLDAADVSRKSKRALQESIRAAVNSVERGKIETGINQLKAFEHKLQAQLGSDHPALAANLSATTEALIEALGNCGGGKE